jgi:hypothetical protein
MFAVCSKRIHPPHEVVRSNALFVDRKRAEALKEDMDREFPVGEYWVEEVDG